MLYQWVTSVKVFVKEVDNWNENEVENCKVFHGFTLIQA